MPPLRAAVAGRRGRPGALGGLHGLRAEDREAEEVGDQGLWRGGRRRCSTSRTTCSASPCSASRVSFSRSHASLNASWSERRRLPRPRRNLAIRALRHRPELPQCSGLTAFPIHIIIIRVRIGAIEVELIAWPAVDPPFAWRRGLRGSHPARTNAVLRITTEDGAVGEAFHEWSGVMLKDIVDRILRPELVGERADRRESIWHRLWELDRTEEFPIWLIGIVDVALWDLEGGRSALPCTAYLALTVSRSLHTLRRRPSPTVEEFLDVATSALTLASRRSSSTLGAMRAPTPTCQRLRNTSARTPPDV